jgi:hypothetical protein
MATPVMAGLAALVRQYYREGFYPIGVENTARYGKHPCFYVSCVTLHTALYFGVFNHTLLPTMFSLPQFLSTSLGFNPMGALVKAVLINSGNALRFPAGNEVGAAGALPSMTQGFGRVTVDNTLFFPNSTRVLYADGDFDSMPTVTTGSTKTYKFFVFESTEDFKVTLVWHDAPASTQSTVQLVNNLDLVVTTPNGQTLFPNGRNAPDTLNNVEQVTVLTADLVQGEYTVTVRGMAVPVGPQPFAVAVSGDFVRDAEKYGASVVPAVREVSLFESSNDGSINFIQVAARVTRLPSEDALLHRFSLWCQNRAIASFNPEGVDEPLSGLDSFPRMQADLNMQETAFDGGWVLRADLDLDTLLSLTGDQGLEDSEGEWKWTCPEGKETVATVTSSGLTSETLQVIFVDTVVPPNGGNGGEGGSSSSTVAIAASVAIVGAFGMLATAYFVSKKGIPKMGGSAAKASSQQPKSKGIQGPSKGNTWNDDAVALTVLADGGNTRAKSKKAKKAWISGGNMDAVL